MMPIVIADPSRTGTSDEGHWHHFEVQAASIFSSPSFIPIRA
jgi:hypothetical protein